MEELQKKKTPFQNERVSIKIEKVHCMIRGSSGETIYFLRRNRKFHGVKQRVPRHGTLCFPTWNTSFHAGKLSASYGKEQIIFRILRFCGRVWSIQF